MSSAGTIYTRELRQRFGYSATWVPNAEVRLGDVGTLDGHTYRRVASLGDFGIEFDVRESRTRGVYEFASAGSVSFGFKAEGEPGGPLSSLATAEAGISIDFSSGNASVFQAAGCTVAEISDQHRLGEQLLQLDSEDRWRREYVVVCELIRADRATVLVSSTSGAQVEFRTKAGIPLGPQSLVDAEAGLNLARSHGLALQIVTEGDLTPLFRARGIKRRLLQRPVFRRIGGARETHDDAVPASPAPPPTESEFAEMDYDDFD
jgi:hypothetical protein